jgi:hypothetical protein
MPLKNPGKKDKKSPEKTLDFFKLIYIYREKLFCVYLKFPWKTRTLEML